MRGTAFQNWKDFRTLQTLGFFHILAICMIKNALFDFLNQIYVPILTSINLKLFLSLGNDSYNSISTIFS